MFQYATAVHLAIKQSSALVIIPPFSEGNPHSTYRLDVFSLPKGKVFNKYLAKIINYIWQTETYENYTLGFHPEVLRLQGNYQLLGYFQSERYFEDIESHIRSAFARNNATLPASAFEQQLSEEISGSNSLCVHIRRGDFIGQGHSVCDAYYYERGVDWVKQRTGTLVIYLFSDDIAWCKKRFRWKNCRFVAIENGERRDDREFFLMAKCKHFVISNSSFSWWAAWLGCFNQKIVVAPDKWLADGAFNTEDLDLTPSGWTIIPASLVAEYS